MSAVQQIDSADVAREIKRLIWPFLREQGFTVFSAKTAWRYSPEQIHVINFQSFNRYLADCMGCTNFSFAVNLGIYFRMVPEQQLASGRQDPVAKPQEFHCQFRQKLLKGIEQLPESRAGRIPAALDRDDLPEVLAKIRNVLARPGEPRRDIWFVNPDSSNLIENLLDARSVIEQDGFAWFAQFSSLERVLELLLAGNLTQHADLQAPAGKYLTGHIARFLGRRELADAMLEDAHREFRQIEARFDRFRRAGRTPS